jgi:(p)ppGpp synthase/HD superfamily hydrolase
MMTEAAAFAIRAHGAQKYGGALPYAYHLGSVVAVLLRFGFDDPDLLKAAWLHDVLEDTDESPKAIERWFGLRVLGLVQAVTNEPGKNRRERHEKTYPKTREAGRLAVALKLADRIANVEASLLSTSDFSKLQMYRKEHPAFIDALFRPEDDLSDLWSYLYTLIEAKPLLRPAAPAPEFFRVPG